jgi:NADH:ubiquinone oxidoreductase subunit E
MLPIAICVGSSCHLKGSYDVIEAFRKEVAARKLEDKSS